MTITIPSFLYFALVCLVFFNVRTGLKNGVLSIASLLYVFWLNQYAGVWAVIVSLMAWGGGWLIHYLIKNNRNIPGKMATCILIIASVGALSVFKYTPLIGQTSELLVNRVVMPLGFSFYIFQAISMYADIYKGKSEPERNWFNVVLYLFWFPKFISGPIERIGEFGHQIKNAEKTAFFDADRWNTVIFNILIGWLYKCVIADRLGVYVDIIFSEHDQFGGLWLTLGILMYSFQIYFDFAGYSYVAYGISLAFGIRLTQNFLMPYCSSNITEFWRRWHRSMSSWLRDYVYIPLGGNRRGRIRKSINVFVVFVLCGMWHGAGIGFLVWGGLHGLYSLIDLFLKEKKIDILRTGVIGRIVTFIEVSFAWVFFRAPETKTALSYLASIFIKGLSIGSFKTEWHALGLNKIEVGLIVAFLFGMGVLDLWAYKNESTPAAFFERKHYIIRYGSIVALLLIIIVFGIYGPAFDNSRMIYMQF